MHEEQLNLAVIKNPVFRSLRCLSCRYGLTLSINRAVIINLMESGILLSRDFIGYGANVLLMDSDRVEIYSK